MKDPVAVETEEVKDVDNGLMGDFFECVSTRRAKLRETDNIIIKDRKED